MMGATAPWGTADEVEAAGSEAKDTGLKVTTPRVDATLWSLT